MSASAERHPFPAARPVTRLGTEYGGQWIGCTYVAEILGMADTRPARLKGLPCRKASPIPGVQARRATLYREADIRRIRQVMDEGPLPFKMALLVVVAEIEGRI